MAEAVAATIARAGGWKAMRRFYRIAQRDGALVTTLVGARDGDPITAWDEPIADGDAR